MAVFIQCSTDAFSVTRAQAAAEGAMYENVRRPLRGIQVKPNTYAVLRAKKANGDDIYLFDSSATENPEEGDTGIGRGVYYANFLIQRYGEQRVEKQQVIETFGEDYVYFFGERPRFLDVSGILINTADFEWKREFWTNYDMYLRGTKLVEQNARVYLYLDDAVIEGYIVSASTQNDSSAPNMLPFSFQLFVTNYQIIGPVGSMYIPSSDRSGYFDDPNPTYVDPEITAEKLAGNQAPATGINAFLAKTSKLANNATFAVQEALEKVRNTLYASRAVVPSGIGTMANDVKMFPPLQSQLSMTEAPTNRPIYEMRDEYVSRSPMPLTGAAHAAYFAEYQRLTNELARRSPEELEAAARKAFEDAGIDTGEPSIARLIVGRGAFAAIQYLAPFGISRLNPKAKQAVEGTLELL